MASSSFKTKDAYDPTAIVRFNDPLKQITISVATNGATAKFILTDISENPYPKDFQPDEHPMTMGVWKWTSDDFKGLAILGVQLRSSLAASPADIVVYYA